MRNLVLAATLTLGLGCSATPALAPSPQAAVTAARGTHATEAAWLIGSQFGQGSGTVVSCDPNGDSYRVLILTALHVVDVNATMPEFPLKAWRQGTWLYGGTVLSTHATLDAALVEFQASKPLAVARLAQHAPEVMDRVYAAGYSGGRGQMWVSGGLSSGPGRATAPVTNGDSGGPVFNAAGEIIGVVRAIETQEQGRRLIMHHLKYEAIGELMPWLTTHLN